MILMCISAGIRIVGDEVHGQGRSWKPPINSPLHQVSVEESKVIARIA